MDIHRSVSLIKRNAVLLGASAITVCIAAGPASATVVSEDIESTTSAAGQSAPALDQPDSFSEARLIGTSALFLLLGIGTLSGTHRRRWREIDVRDKTVEVKPATAVQL